MCGQVPTVPMQSVRLGGGALGFAFPKNRFILGGREENPNTRAKTENGSRFTSASALTSGPHAQAQSAYRSFPILFPAFHLGLPGKESSRRLEMWDRESAGGVASLKGVGRGFS